MFIVCGIKKLTTLGIDEEDGVKISQKNKILKCISMCKKLHGGPLTTLDELTELVKSWKGTEKLLHTLLNLEIRLHKADCLLFKQMKLSIKEKERNLSQLDFKTLADMSDLEAAIVGSSNVEEQSNVEEKMVQT